MNKTNTNTNASAATTAQMTYAEEMQVQAEAIRDANSGARRRSVSEILAALRNAGAK
jgi:hypothetical protein